MTSVLALSLPCPKCRAKAGQPCVRLDGNLAARPHVRRTPLAPCGSYGGYQRHQREGSEPCAQCAEANRRHMAEYRRANPEVRRRDIDLLRARHKATRLLVLRHRDEFKQLLVQAQAQGVTA